MCDLDECYEKDPSIVSRSIADESILVPVRQNMADFESVYTLEGVGARIWELIDGQRSVGEIKDIIVEEYNVGPDVAETDLVDFIRQLATLGAVRRV